MYTYAAKWSGKDRLYVCMHVCLSVCLCVCLSFGVMSFRVISGKGFKLQSPSLLNIINTFIRHSRNQIYNNKQHQQQQQKKHSKNTAVGNQC